MVNVHIPIYHCKGHAMNNKTPFPINALRKDNLRLAIQILLFCVLLASLVLLVVVYSANYIPEYHAAKALPLAVLAAGALIGLAITCVKH